MLIIITNPLQYKKLQFKPYPSRKHVKYQTVSVVKPFAVGSSLSKCTKFCTVDFACDISKITSFNWLVVGKEFALLLKAKDLPL